MGKLVIGILLALGGAAAGLLISKAQAPVPKPIADPKPYEALSLTGEINDLKREVAALKESNARSVRPGTESSGSQRADDQSESLTEEQRKQKATEWSRSYRDKLDLTLQAEPRDSSWAVEQEGRIDEVIGASADAGIKLDSVNCASTMCRVVVTESEGARPVARQVGSKPPFQQGTYYAYDGPVTTMYVTRAGKNLPNPPR